MGSGKPIDLVLGKKFKLEVWEVIVQKMAINEVAQFTVHKSVRQRISGWQWAIIGTYWFCFSLYYSILLYQKRCEMYTFLMLNANPIVVL